MAVACTQFAFNNSELISLLKQRGNAISTEKWDKQRDLDAKINQLKKEKLQDFIRPVSVFMTFENEEACMRAKYFNETISIPGNEHLVRFGRWFDEFELNIQEASEPSDIIWENRHYTDE